MSEALIKSLEKQLQIASQSTRASTPAATCCICNSNKVPAFSIRPPEHLGGSMLHFCSKSCYQNWESLRSCAICARTCVPIFSVTPPLGFGRAAHFCSKDCYQEWNNKSLGPLPPPTPASQQQQAQQQPEPDARSKITPLPLNALPQAQGTDRSDAISVWSDACSTCDGSSYYSGATGSTWRTGDSQSYITGDSRSYISCSTYGSAVTGRTAASRRSQPSKFSRASAVQRPPQQPKPAPKAPDMFAAEPKRPGTSLGLVGDSSAAVAALAAAKPPLAVRVSTPVRTVTRLSATVRPPTPHIVGSVNQSLKQQHDAENKPQAPPQKTAVAAVTLGIPDEVAKKAPATARSGQSQRSKQSADRSSQIAKKREELWRMLNPPVQKEPELSLDMRRPF
eukprot:TRINITY_DN9940_c0_g1_i1.p1 TRINITY_DN9940_c0_g1~~TRINITY_DN9940_c0_g1_i1.p1  ORF type:complete len:402 (+),score=68.51 TRINITY_DN9940_c0_g1_i1:25-1206(+)